MKHILFILLLLCSITASAQEHEIAAPNCELRIKATPGIDAYCKICGEKQQKERLAKQNAEEQKLASIRAAQKAATEKLAAERTQQKQALANKLKSAPKEGMILVAPTPKPVTPIKETTNTYTAEDKELLALAEKGKLSVEMRNNNIIFFTTSGGERTNMRTIPFVPEPHKDYHPREVQPEGYSIVHIGKENDRGGYPEYARDIIDIKGEFLIGDTTVKHILPCGEKWVLLMRQTKPGINSEKFKEIDKLELYNWQTKERIPFPDEVMSTNALEILWHIRAGAVQLPLKVNNNVGELWDFRPLKTGNAINLAAVWDLKKMNAAGQYFCPKKQQMPADVTAGLSNNNMLFLVLITSGGYYADFATYGFDVATKKLSLLHLQPAGNSSLMVDWFAEICR